MEFAHEGSVGTTVAADKAESVDHDSSGNQRVGSNDAVHFVQHFLGALHRRGRGQSDIDHEYAVVLGGHESRRGGAQQQNQNTGEHDDDPEGDRFHVHHLSDQTAVFVFHRLEEYVESLVEA